MNRGKSRCVPQHPHWHEDLPDRDALADRAPAMLDGDVIAMDDVCLDVSRASTLMRGLGVAFGLFGVALVVFSAVFLGRIFFPLERDLVAPLIIVSLGLFILVYAVLLLLRTDLCVSRDRPVRFSRARRKVYVYEHAYGMNLFSKWPVGVKEFDWDTLRAEIHRRSGFGGKAYVQRFALSLVSCKPGTNEAMDRFDLKGNWPTAEELRSTWAFCRHYMEEGAKGLANHQSRSDQVSFRRSLFEYMRFLDPTEDGRAVRRRMTVGDWAFNLPLTALMFWLFIPWGMGHYVAMRCAPGPSWPSGVEVESREV
ncbi:hypothetical protein QFW77_13270 [Luteimonas sp. RD2P54]|uniref:DUF6708 domain-containing protein n=1 Tax=Luteimonas endophytica TaxID=3042023 RepID=A0ABT6JCM1_9GAMM|nr:DUF6708 domain-containing protein [Luteimonas endophytica]MDH5823948.1 hypothetical protein [Luteimonas endophytica]